MNIYITAAPKAPVPLITDVIVDVANFIPTKLFCLERSIAITEIIKLYTPPKNTPIKNIKI